MGLSLGIVVVIVKYRGLTNCGKIPCDLASHSLDKSRAEFRYKNGARYSAAASYLMRFAPRDEANHYL
jgi:hypothetical protein